MSRGGRFRWVTSCYGWRMFCGMDRRNRPQIIEKSDEEAERGGFEPPARVLPGQLLSRQPCSATPAPLRGRRHHAKRRNFSIIGDALEFHHNSPRLRLRRMMKNGPPRRAVITPTGISDGAKRVRAA